MDNLWRAEIWQDLTFSATIFLICICLALAPSPSGSVEKLYQMSGKSTYYIKKKKVTALTSLFQLWMVRRELQCEEEVLSGKGQTSPAEAQLENATGVGEGLVTPVQLLLGHEGMTMQQWGRSLEYQQAADKSGSVCNAILTIDPFLIWFCV